MEKNIESESKFLQEPEKIKVAIAVRVRQLRQQNKMTLENVAEVTGISASYLYRIEHGEKLPSLSVIYKLAEAYQVSSEELLGIHEATLIIKKMDDVKGFKYPIEDRTYTLSEYIEWSGRWELISGVPYSMTPPDMRHQRVVSRLCIALGSHLGSHFGNKEHEVFTGPLGVHLNKKDNKETVVQPDIIVVNGLYSLDRKVFKRAPEVVVEVLSPSSAKRDRVTKFDLYKENGVLEYWIVDPVHETIEVYSFTRGALDIANVSSEGIIQSEYFRDFKIPLRLIFE